MTDEVFLKQYLIASIYRKKDDSKGLDEISDDRYCYTLLHFNNNERVSREKAFSERVKAQDEALFGVTKADKLLSPTEGVINGKAVSLPKPPYPDEAKSRRIAGRVAVKIVINEEGNVVSARGFCGDPVFYPVTEAAARSAKFTQTRLNGAPTRVTGIITYNFVPPR